MRRMLAVGVLVAATSTVVASPAEARITANSFGSSGTLAADGRVAVVSLLIGCTAPGSIHVTVTVTQGDTSGVGHFGGRCTGNDFAGEVRVPFDENFEPGQPNDSAFTTGPARVCGRAVNKEPGGSQDIRRWCSEVLLQSEPQRTDLAA